VGDLNCSHDDGEHRMKICDSGKDGEVRLLFVAHVRALSDREGDLFRRQFGGKVGAGDARTVDAGAFEMSLGNFDAAFERGRWIVVVGTHTGCWSAESPNQANVPEPLGYVNSTSLW